MKVSITFQSLEPWRSEDKYASQFTLSITWKLGSIYYRYSWMICQKLLLYENKDYFCQEHNANNLAVKLYGKVYTNEKQWKVVRIRTVCYSKQLFPWRLLLSNFSETFRKLQKVSPIVRLIVCIILCMISSQKCSFTDQNCLRAGWHSWPGSEHETIIIERRSANLSETLRIFWDISDRILLSKNDIIFQ